MFPRAMTKKVGRVENKACFRIVKTELTQLLGFMFRTVARQER